MVKKYDITNKLNCHWLNHSFIKLNSQFYFFRLLNLEILSTFQLI